VGQSRIGAHGAAEHFTALAPLLFGWVSTELGAISPAFLIMLVPLLINAALILFVARKTYPPDVATAAASEYYAG
jgi:hypothetical protein